MEPNDAPGEYVKYLTDSIKIEYSPDFGPMQKTYWIDTLIHECIYIEAENKCYSTGQFKFNFFDKNDKMRQDILGPALYKTCILKRIK